MTPRQKKLITRRLVLKPMEAHDRPRMMDILWDAQIKKTYMLPDFENQAQADAMFERLMGFSQSQDRFFYGIYHDNALVGFINECQRQDSVMELGYVIATAHQGNGYATEALKACIAELFRMGFSQVKAGFFAGNTPSQRVMEKSGMEKLTFEEDIEYRGVLRHCFYYGIHNPKTGNVEYRKASAHDIQPIFQLCKNLHDIREESIMR